MFNKIMNGVTGSNTTIEFVKTMHEYADILPDGFCTNQWIISTGMPEELAESHHDNWHFAMFVNMKSKSAFISRLCGRYVGDILQMLYPLEYINGVSFQEKYFHVVYEADEPYDPDLTQEQFDEMDDDEKKACIGEPKNDAEEAMKKLREMLGIPEDMDGEELFDFVREWDGNMTYYEEEDNEGNIVICYPDRSIVENWHRFSEGDRLMLREMPFDKDGHHSTGFAVFNQTSDGSLIWMNEYED